MGSRAPAGQRVFGIKHWSGYRYMRIKNVMVAMHRVVFTLTHGRRPRRDIDHRDRNRSNNRTENLREATNSENGFNANLFSNNTSGHRGVNWDRWQNAWRATIMIDGKRRHVKQSKDKNVVVKAYRAAASKHRKGFYSGA